MRCARRSVVLPAESAGSMDNHSVLRVRRGVVLSPMTDNRPFGSREEGVLALDRAMFKEVECDTNRSDDHLDTGGDEDDGKCELGERCTEGYILSEPFVIEGRE